MKILLALVLFLFAAKVSSETFNGYEVHRHILHVPADLDSWVYQGKVDINGKISNGNQATDDQFPWTAQLAINLDFGVIPCTASIISNRWLLGARHCIADHNPVSVHAFLGSSDSQNLRVQAYSDVAVWLNSPTGRNHPDIALFRLIHMLSFSSYVREVRLPARSQENWSFEGWRMRVSGWGATGSRFLQWADFQVLPLGTCQVCDNLFFSQPKSEMVLAQMGDIGAPGVIFENGIPTQIAIHVAVEDGYPPFVHVATRVSLFLDFISFETGLPIRN